MTTKNDLDRLGVHIYGHNTLRPIHMASESLATVTQYTPSGARVNGRGDQGVVSHEQDDAADKPTPERWRLDEVRPTTDVYSTGNDDFDAIGARMSARHDAGGVVTVDNRHVLNDTPGLPGFDY